MLKFKDSFSSIAFLVIGFFSSKWSFIFSFFAETVFFSLVSSVLIVHWLLGWLLLNPCQVILTSLICVVSLPPFPFSWPFQSICDWNMDIWGCYGDCSLLDFLLQLTSSDGDGEEPRNYCQVWLSQGSSLDVCWHPRWECLLVTALWGWVPSSHYTST